MRFRLTTLFLVGSILAGCASGPADQSAERVSDARTLDAYKRDLALRISEVNANKVYPGRPQALLRSVVVVRYWVDARGRLARSEIMRSNRDRETEGTALATLRNSAPFPQPAPHLLRNGRLELSETWLFNTDGRFQLRTIAQPQMDR